MAKKTLSVRVVENVDKLQIEISKLFDPLYRVSLERLQTEREDLYKRFKEVRRKRPRLVFAYQSRRSLSLGWYSPDRWEIKDRSVDEIAILPSTVSRGIYDTANTLVHELAHFVNHALGIKDTSRGGRYHNTRFRYMANLFALEVDTFGRYGLAKTDLTKELIADVKRIVKERNIDVKLFKLKRKENPPKSNLTRIDCPKCEAFVYILNGRLHQFSIHCGACNIPLRPTT